MWSYWREVFTAAFWSSIEAVGYSGQILLYLLIVASLTALFVWKPKGWDEMRANAMKTIFEVILWGIAAWLPFFLLHIGRVSYLRWKEADDLAKTLSLKLDQSKPQFTVMIGGGVSFYDDLKDYTLWLPIVTIVNKGVSSSISRWQAHYKSPTLDQDVVVALLLNESLKTKVPGGASFPIRAEDAINARTDPVKQGEIVKGRLPIRIPGNRGKEIISGASISIIDLPPVFGPVIS